MVYSGSNLVKEIKIGTREALEVITTDSNGTKSLRYYWGGPYIDSSGSLKYVPYQDGVFTETLNAQSTSGQWVTDKKIRAFRIDTWVLSTPVISDNKIELVTIGWGAYGENPDEWITVGLNTSKTELYIRWYFPNIGINRTDTFTLSTVADGSSVIINCWYSGTDIRVCFTYSDSGYQNHSVNATCQLNSLENLQRYFLTTKTVGLRTPQTGGSTNEYWIACDKA